MKVSQSKEKIFVKGLSNTDVQLLTVVKRYLENNPEEILTSIDGIVLEVLRRVKEDLLSGNIVLPSQSKSLNDEYIRKDEIDYYIKKALNQR